MNEPILSVTGNLVADPELRFTQGGKAVCSMRLASTPRKKNAGTQQWEDGTTLWLSLTAWGQLGENCAETLSKGMKVVVTGRLGQRDWTDKEGNNRVSFEVQVDSIGPDLNNATAVVNKISRTGVQQGQFNGQGAPVAQDPWMTGSTTAVQQQPQPTYAPQQQNPYPPAAEYHAQRQQQAGAPQQQYAPQPQPLDLPPGAWNGQPQQGQQPPQRAAQAPAGARGWDDSNDPPF